jgi:hypothetical protein
MQIIIVLETIMSKSILEQLEKQLTQFLGEAVPDQAVYDIHAAGCPQSTRIIDPGKEVAF